MKLNKLFITSLTLLTALTTLVGCSTPSGDEIWNDGPISDPHHTCKFDQQVPTTQYRASPKSCGHAATYYYSCVCGAKGSETFEYGTAKEHTYVFTVVDYQSQYLVGEVFNASSLQMTLSCEKCDFTSNVDASKLIIPTDPLTADTTSVTIGYTTNDGVINKDLTVQVDMYKTTEVDIYVNSSNKVMLSISGVYGQGYESKIEAAEFYLTANKDVYKFASANPVCNATNKTFKAEIDVTDMYFSPREKVTTVTNDFVYWPHFVIENEAGVKEDKDIRFVNLQMKEVKRNNDPSGESYILNLYKNESTDKYIPVVARATTNPVPSFQYLTERESTNYKIPDNVSVAYMPTGCDIEKVDDKAIWSVNFIFKGFTREADLFRAFSMYLYKYPNNSDYNKYYFSYDGAASNHGNFKDDFVVNFETDSTGTFTVKVDITNFEISNSTNPGYWTRVASTDKTGPNDAKIGDSANNGKAITIGTRVYTIVNVHNGGKSQSWGCLGFKITNA